MNPEGIIKPKKTLMFLSKHKKNLGVESVEYIKQWISDFYFKNVTYYAVDEIVSILRAVNVNTKITLV